MRRVIYIYLTLIHSRLIGLARGHRYPFAAWDIARCFREPVEAWEL